jgi:hypothetical protein
MNNSKANPLLYRNRVLCFKTDLMVIVADSCYLKIKTFLPSRRKMRAILKSHPLFVAMNQGRGLNKLPPVIY